MLKDEDKAHCNHYDAVGFEFSGTFTKALTMKVTSQQTQTKEKNMRKPQLSAR